MLSVYFAIRVAGAVAGAAAEMRGQMMWGRKVWRRPASAPCPAALAGELRAEREAKM